jgi:hypothetical protein
MQNNAVNSTRAMVRRLTGRLRYVARLRFGDTEVSSHGLNERKQGKRQLLNAAS